MPFKFKKYQVIFLTESFLSKIAENCLSNRCCDTIAAQLRIFPFLPENCLSNHRSDTITAQLLIFPFLPENCLSNRRCDTIASQLRISMQYLHTGAISDASEIPATKFLPLKLSLATQLKEQRKIKDFYVRHSGRG
ncbi:hypothetical protein AVEN_109512-1 [Araneus ventricosus]|uniref:Uncharacterized protein n=1 Tax=Araneus ventricosus TaxID=182803 RepID=A0A4Y2G175_ARAVE|nr:hypothetical protein AVEN_109512-1 [Araneus ventricosus]